MQIKIYPLTFVLIIWAGIIESLAQTNPVAQSLPYSQNFAALVSSSSIYPAGWQGWNLSTTGPTTTFRTIAPPAASDLSLIASSTAASSVGGIQNYTDKIGFLPSTTVDPALCLAISTTGFNTISVAFDVMTIRNPFDASNTRIDQVDLQFRVGTAGIFSTVSGVASGIYQNNTVNQVGAVTTPQNSLSKTFTLPASCNNQVVVQLRWVVRDVSGVGNRPGFAVDNIVICSSSVTPAISIAGPAAFCSGNSAIYTATPVNGGSTPVYQWKKNGVIVGTNSPVLNISGLIVGNQISCVMTSNAPCATSLTATSNTITIGTVLSSPTITSAILSDVTCPGASNGSIQLAIAGGSPPYSVCWDTVNTLNGPTFGVTVATKSAQHPFFNQGNPLAYQIDGVEAKIVKLVKGLTYTFNVLTPGHPFHISTDSVGGNVLNLVAAGQSGAPTTSGTVTFTPGNTTPSLLYYPCQAHTFMGYRIVVGSGYCTSGSSLTGAHAGKYAVIVSDANGCTTSATYTLSELPSPVSIASVLSNASCGGSDGAIDLTISGGTAPYSICWDTLNTTGGNQFGVMVDVKTASNPFFGLGNLLSFFIDGEEAKPLNLVRGIPYSFNVLSPTHPWHITSDPVGGSLSGFISSGQSGGPNDNGTVLFTPNSTHSAHLYYGCANHQYMGGNVSISDGYCTEDLSALHPGKYSVIVRDATGCVANATFTIVEEGPPVSLLNSTSPSCYGSADGTIDLQASSLNGPFTITGTGPVFSVIAEVKNHSHPQFGLGGRPDGFTIDGVQGRELTLIRGITYAFSVFAPTHSFFISTSNVGGPLNVSSVVTTGVQNNFIASGTLYFTPDASHPNELFYQCGIHDYMGWRLNIVDGISEGNLSNAMGGEYNLSLVDANGCPSQPLPIVLPQPAPTTFYYDGDSDNFGVSTETTLGCNPPPGFTTLAGDCNDANPLITGTISYTDADLDGYGDAATIVGSCILPPGNVLNGLDCNDADNSIHPGAIDVCNGIDDDCDGIIDNGPSCNILISVFAFIQGYFDGINQMIPVVSPQANPTLCDTIMVELLDINAPFEVLYSSKGVLGTNGIGSFSFPIATDGASFYIVLKHRSSLAVWSADPVQVFDHMQFNIQTDPSFVMGHNLADLGNGYFGMWTGDVNQDGVIDAADFNSVETDLPLFTRGYFPQDLDGNSIIESADYSLIDNNSDLGLIVIHP